MKQAELNEAKWRNPAHGSGPGWASRCFSKKDTRTWASKAVPWMGWTLNLGKPAGAQWMWGFLVGLPLSVILLALLIMCSSLAGCAQKSVPGTVDLAAAPDRVSFEGGAPVRGALTLTGRLGKPEGKGPFPALVLLHGCGGMQASDTAWAKRFNDWGYVSLQVDSFRPRGLTSTCTYSGKAFEEILANRVDDAQAARGYLAGLPFVDGSRIAVVGWSQGGDTTLNVLYKEDRLPFRAAVAFYPPCRQDLSGIKTPLLILIGEADDWTPASRCTERMPKGQAASPVLLKTYPGAFHAFDRPGKPHNVAGSRGSVHHLEYHPAAAEDSIRLTREFLAKHLQ